ncbi:MAG: hypothetical protein EZS28_002288 [Streblomastix strix]|uniref:Reverse transcriptase domain-containing protein n=1 Tax=Streblomastix strix TaxID=222440 RepID=A0A5J4X4N0_9EUKA|nr:MAG: hypothetical protein EZS28_002288 [Streblomastix strix]
MDIIERMHKIMNPIIEEEKKKPNVVPKVLNLSEEQWNQFDGDLREGVVPYQSYIPGLLNVSSRVSGFINIHPQIYQSIPEAVIGLITFVAQQIVESDTESKDKVQLTNQIERIVVDGTDDNEDNDQSEHIIEPKHFTNGNDGLRKNDCGMQLQATVNGEANPEINITKISANTPPHNVDGSDGHGGNGCVMQLQAATNEIEHINHYAMDNTGNESNNEQVNDNRTGGQQNNQGSNNEIQNQQDNGNTQLKETGSSRIIHSEKELRNPITSQSKGQPPLVTTPPQLGQVKWKVVVLKQRIQQANDNDTRSKTGQPKSVPNKSLRIPIAGANSDIPNHFTPQQKQRKKADVAPVTEDKSAKHSKSNKTSAGSKKQKQGFNSKKVRKKQSPIPRLTSRISLTDYERKEQRSDCGDFENPENDNEYREIFDRNEGTDSKILGKMGNNYLEKFHPIKIQPPMERKLEYQQAMTQVKDNEIQRNIRRSERVQDNVRRRTKREFCNTDQKSANQMVQPDIHDKKIKREIEKDTGCESVEQIDCRVPLQDVRFERVQTESQPYLALEFQNNNYIYRTLPFGTKHSPIYFATAMEPTMQQTRMKTEIRVINNDDDILLLHQNKEYLKNMTQNVIDTLKYFGFTMNTEKSETELNQTVIFLGWEWNLANATVKTKPKKRLLLQHDLYNMRRWTQTRIEITVKWTAKLIGKLNYLRLQFQEASLFLNIMDHQQAQTAKLRG